MASKEIHNSRTSRDEDKYGSVLEWRASVCKALFPDSSEGIDTVSQQQQPPRQHHSSSALRAKLPLVWPWLLRASHSCGHAVLVFLAQSSSLAVEDCDYRDSYNALGLDTIECQWQTWNLTRDISMADPSL